MLGRPTKEAVVIQELLGHRDVSTTMIYTLVLNRGPAAAFAVLDGSA